MPPAGQKCPAGLFILNQEAASLYWSGNILPKARVCALQSFPYSVLCHLPKDQPSRRSEIHLSRRSVPFHRSDLFLMSLMSQRSGCRQSVSHLSERLYRLPRLSGKSADTAAVLHKSFLSESAAALNLPDLPYSASQ